MGLDWLTVTMHSSTELVVERMAAVPYVSDSLSLLVRGQAAISLFNFTSYRKRITA